jgi:diketogulonate reductase-like aldo/keto reductase
MNSPVVQNIAKRLGCNAAQVIFRFASQIGMLPLTGTSSAQHMKEDLECDKLELTPQELAQIETINK